MRPKATYVRASLQILAGALLGFALAFLLLRRGVSLERRESSPHESKSPPRDTGVALRIESLACVVSLNFSPERTGRAPGRPAWLSVVGTVKNLGEHPVESVVVAFDMSFPAPYTLYPLSDFFNDAWAGKGGAVSASVCLPPHLAGGQIASFKIRERLGAPELPFPSPREGDFVGHITALASPSGYADVVWGTSTVEQSCWFKNIEFPMPLDECDERKRGTGGYWRWKDGECGGPQRFDQFLRKRGLKWLSDTEVLFDDPDRPVLFVFGVPPREIDLNNLLWFVKDGAFPYVNKFGARLEVPRIKIRSGPSWTSSTRGPLGPDPTPTSLPH